MQVLVLTADYVPGAWSGIGAAVAAQAAAVARAGVDVDVIVRDEPVARRAASGDRLRVHALRRSRFPLRPDRFDVVHVHSLGLAELALQLRSRFGVRLVYTAHASLRDELAGRADAVAWTQLQDVLIARSDHVIFLSAEERAAATRRSPALLWRSSVLPNGVGAATVPVSASPRSGPIVFAGRFAETKGLSLLQEIVGGLQDHPALRFVLAGGHGDRPGRSAVRRLVARHPDRCQAVGWLQPAALERLLSTASMALVPSRYEPFGMVALEAMRAGTPVVAAATGGLREVVGPGSGGILVHSRRPEDWRAAILSLWRAPERRGRLARRGPAYVAERYHPDALAHRLVDAVYRPLAAGGMS